MLAGGVVIVCENGRMPMGSRIYRTGLLFIAALVLLISGGVAGMHYLLPRPPTASAPAEPLPGDAATADGDNAPVSIWSTAIPGVRTVVRSLASIPGGMDGLSGDDPSLVLLIAGATGLIIFVIWRVARRRRLRSDHQTMLYRPAAGVPAGHVVHVTSMHGLLPAPPPASSLSTGTTALDEAVSVVSPRAQRIQIACVLAPAPAVRIDEIATITRLPTTTIERVLLEMQRAGLVVQETPGGAYRVYRGKIARLLDWARREAIPTPDLPPTAARDALSAGVDLIPADVLHTNLPEWADLVPDDQANQAAALPDDSPDTRGDAADAGETGDQDAPTDPEHAASALPDARADGQTFFRYGAITPSSVCAVNTSPIDPDAVCEAHGHESGDHHSFVRLCSTRGEPMTANDAQTILHTLLQALVSDPRIVTGVQPGVSPKRMWALLPPVLKPHARTLLAWCDAAGILAPAPDPAQPWRTPRPLRLTDVAAITAALARTPLPMPDGETP